MCCHEAKKALPSSYPRALPQRVPELEQGARGPRRPREALHLTCVHVHGYTFRAIWCFNKSFEKYSTRVGLLCQMLLGGGVTRHLAGACLGVGVTWEYFQGPECGGSLIPAVVPRGGLRKSALCVRRALLGEFTRPQPLHGPLAGLGSQLAPWRLTKFRVRVYQRRRCSAREVEHCRTSDMAGRGDRSHESCPGNCSFSQPPSRADSPGPNPPGTLI